MKNEEWLKLHTKVFENALFKSLLADGYESSRVVLVWIQLLVLARKLNNKRIVLSKDTPYTIKQLAATFMLFGKKGEKLLQNSLEIFEKNDMIFIQNNVIEIIGWESYQSADRLDKIREKEAVKKRKQRSKCPGDSPGDSPSDNALNNKRSKDVFVSESVRDLSESSKNLQKGRKSDDLLTGACLEAFSSFWKLYPKSKKVGEDDVKAWFVKKNPTPETVSMILEGLKAYKSSQGWADENGRWIPFPIKFLNNTMWTADVGAPVTSAIEPKPEQVPETEADDLAELNKVLEKYKEPKEQSIYAIR